MCALNVKPRRAGGTSALRRWYYLIEVLSLSLASPCSLILCRVGVCQGASRAETAGICLTKSSEEAAHFDPLPNSQRPLSFGRPSPGLSRALSDGERETGQAERGQEAGETIVHVLTLRSLVVSFAFGFVSGEACADRCCRHVCYF